MREKYIPSWFFLELLSTFFNNVVRSFTNATDTALLKVVMAAVEGEPFYYAEIEVAYNS